LIQLIRFLPVALTALLSITGASAQQPLQLSSKFYEMQFVRGKLWPGHHRFDGVFCLTFPRSTDAAALAEAMYNNNSLYFSRAQYTDLTALYVVTSRVPPGRLIEAEINNLASQNQKGVNEHPATFTQSRITGLLGPSLRLTVRNATEGEKGSPFPFVRNFVVRPDGRLTSLSIHRLFVHNGNRIEVAGLRFFKTPVEPELEGSATSELSELVEAAADSLESCTVKLPQKAVGTPPQ
jgi:hypothetical protein